MHDERKTRQIEVERGVLDENEKAAAENRKKYADLGLFVLNLMSSPGSGKTTLLERTLASLKGKFNIGVIVGDVCTANDADRLKAAADAQVVQVNTEPFGGDCHLTAPLVYDAAAGMDLDDLELLIVENLGNLVCPAEFDIGEDARAVMLSVTEGEDKPIKYPLMFRVCDLAILSKIDLVPHLDFDMNAAVDYIRQVHDHIKIIKLSAKTGEGMDEWTGWLSGKVEAKKSSRAS